MKQTHRRYLLLKISDTPVTDDYDAFAKVNNRLLNPPTPLKSVPLRIYIPSTPNNDSASAEYKAMQTLMPPRTSSRKSSLSPSPPPLPLPPTFSARPGTHDLTPLRVVLGGLQTLGTALRTLLPTLFPSSRDPVLANIVMHGAPVPFSAPLEDLMREAAYPDGWLCLIVVLL